MKINRRRASQLLAAMPAAIAFGPASSRDLGQVASQPKPPATLASCIVAAESSLSADERARLEKAVASLERSLQAIRDFKIPPNVDPAMHFRARKSRRRA